MSTELRTCEDYELFIYTLREQFPLRAAQPARDHPRGRGACPRNEEPGRRRDITSLG